MGDAVYNLSMVFETETGESSTFTVTGVKGDLTQTQVEEIAQSIVTNAVFSNSKGDFVKLTSAKIVGKTTNILVGEGAEI